MGTRNLTLVIKDGQYRIAQYCQWDGYPEGQGATILDFLANKMDRERFETALKQTKWITEEGLRKLYNDVGADGSGFINMDQAALFKNRQPQLDRDMGAKVLEFVQESTDPVLLNDQHEFFKDGMFCEWTYVIDLDNNKLEVYGGYNNQEVSTLSRFALDAVGDDRTPVMANAVFDFDNLPDEVAFIKALSEDPDGLTEDDASYVLSVIRARMGEHSDDVLLAETVSHICNYIEANMDDFLEQTNG